MFIPATSDEISLVEWVLGLIITATSGVFAYVLGRIGKLETQVDEMAEAYATHALHGDDEVWKAVNQLQRDFHDYRVQVADRMLAKEDFYKVMAENLHTRSKQQEELLEAIRQVFPRQR